MHNSVMYIIIYVVICICAVLCLLMERHKIKMLCWIKSTVTIYCVYPKLMSYNYAFTCIHCKNIHQEKIFANFVTYSRWQNFIHELLSCANDHIEDMVTFTALLKIYSAEYFCNTKVAGLGKI